MMYTMQRWGVIAVLGVSLLTAGSAYAQEANDIPENLRKVAEELNCKTRAECRAAFNANFDRGVNLASQYDVYNDQQKELAKNFQKEVLQNLQNVAPEQLEQTIIDIAQKILKDKPGLAKNFGVQRDDVRAAQTIRTEGERAGVNINDCNKPAEDLSREALVKCLELSRNIGARGGKAVERYIPRERLERQEEFDRMARLANDLEAGKYPELGDDPDRAGEICLRPGSPAVCDEIAKKYFGEEGVSELTRARAQVGEVDRNSRKDAQRFVLKLSDGRELNGRDEIRKRCDRAFGERDIAVAETCGKFAVDNGFARKEDVAEGLGFLKEAGGRGVDLRRCIDNPQSCEEYIPQNRRGDVGVLRQLEEIMRKYIGFNPRECSKGEFDPEIGTRCFEGSKKAIAEIEGLKLGEKSPQAKRIIDEIKSHIKQGEGFEQRGEDFRKDLQAEGGPGGCRNEQECRAYCENPEHGPECIAFGASKGIFKPEDAVQRFEQYGERYNRIAPPQFQNQEFRGEGPFPGFQPPGQRGTPPGQDIGFRQRGPGSEPPPGLGGRPSFGGPSPECFEAIQSGDFVKAKEACAAPRFIQRNENDERGPERGDRQQLPQRPPFLERPEIQPQFGDQPQGNLRRTVCPSVVPRPDACAPGTIPVGLDEQCRTICKGSELGQDPDRREICPSQPTVNDCPTGSVKKVSYSSPQCGTYYTCVTEEGRVPQCPTGSYWYKPVDRQGYCKPTVGVTNLEQCDYVTQYYKQDGQCAPRSNCTDPANAEYNSSECQGVRNTNIRQPQCAQGQHWNGSACVSSTLPIPGGTPQSCPEGQYWQVPPAGGPGACVANPVPPHSGQQCAQGQYWNGTACVANQFPPLSPQSPPLQPPQQPPQPPPPPPSPPQALLNSGSVLGSIWRIFTGALWESAR